MKEKFKIGDQVRITKSNKNWTKSMDEYNGQIVTISEIRYNNEYQFENFTGNRWSWTVEDGHFEKVVEPEFVLPEKWCIKAKNDQERDIIAKWCNENRPLNESTRRVYLGLPSVRFIHSKEVPNNQGYFRCNNNFNITEGFTEITFEQFQQYVMNPQPVVQQELPQRVFEPLPRYQVNNVAPNGGILSCINNEGSTFEIDDNVVSLGLTATVIRKIIGFRYNNAKTDICAVFRGLPYGISINKLQHYIKPKVVEPIIEETLLEKAKRLYPIGTKFKCVNNNFDTDKVEGCVIVKEYGTQHLTIGVYSGNSWIVLNNNWAEIIPQEPLSGEPGMVFIAEETNLEKAIRLYPVGTKVKCLRGWGWEQGKSSQHETNIISGQPTLTGYNSIYIKGSFFDLTVYQNGIWADIIND